MTQQHREVTAHVVFYLGSAKEGVMLILDALISALSCLNKVIPVTCWSEWPSIFRQCLMSWTATHRPDLAS
jgi:hypothetical protein